MGRTSLASRFFLFLIGFYRRAVSPWLPPACRYTPTCSAYGEEAIRLHGALRGGWLTVKRLSRCHPWGGHGFDPVPLPRGTAAESRNS